MSPFKSFFSKPSRSLFTGHRSSIAGDVDGSSPSKNNGGRNSTEPGNSELAIAIMGATGSGKSTFINLVSGSDLCVGDSLRSCTSEIGFAEPFYLDGRRVFLIDTPGFDDTTRSDTDVLKGISAFLETSYSKGCTLAGVLYFHRICDIRVGGVSARNARMFRKLCGDDTLKNVVIVTNMWGEVDYQTAEARETELMVDDLFFKPALDQGARMARHANTPSSAEDIIRLVFDNHPLPLRIQRELVDESKDFCETDAGGELSHELNAQIMKYQEEVRMLRQEIQQLIREKDEQLRRELEIERENTRKQIERVENEVKRLGPTYKAEKKRFETLLAHVRKKGLHEPPPSWSSFTLRRVHTVR